MSELDSIYRGPTSQQKQYRDHRRDNSPKSTKPKIKTFGQAPNDPSTKPYQVPTYETPQTQKSPWTDVYGGYYPKAKKQAMARSNGQCQFCGQRRAKEGHHWAWPDYPSGETVNHADITALCKPCHEIATIIRNWAGKGNANFDTLAGELEDARSFFEKREALSFWLFPEGEVAEDVENGENVEDEEDLKDDNDNLDNKNPARGHAENKENIKEKIPSPEPEPPPYSTKGGNRSTKIEHTPSVTRTDYIPPRVQRSQAQGVRRRTSQPEVHRRSNSCGWALLLFVLVIVAVMISLYLYPIYSP